METTNVTPSEVRPMVESKPNLRKQPSWWSLDWRTIKPKERLIATTFKPTQKGPNLRLRRTVTNRLCVTYSGMPNDLISMGAVTSELLAPCGSTKARFDADGDRCFIQRSATGRLNVQYHKPEDRALRLPGVTAWLAQETEVSDGR
jgi:hypothetical protein